MRLLFIIDETPFFHPEYLEQVYLDCEKKGHQMMVGIVQNIPKKNSLQSHLIKNWRCLPFLDMVKLGFLSGFYKLMDAIFPKGAFNKMEFIDIKGDINSEKYITDFRAFAPDLLISSNSLLFKQQLLEMPKKGCINRHSSMLPRHGGVWPVLYAILAADNEVGVTIHTMTKKIDGGKIVKQKSFKRLGELNLFKLYDKAFRLSVELTIDAISIYAKDGIRVDSQDIVPQYNSFPSSEALLTFKKIGGRFI
jgi:methionyl-tRNA formyltransferase